MNEFLRIYDELLANVNRWNVIPKLREPTLLKNIEGIPEGLGFKGCTLVVLDRLPVKELHEGLALAMVLGFRKCRGGRYLNHHLEKLFNDVSLWVNLEADCSELLGGDFCAEGFTPIYNALMPHNYRWAETYEPFCGDTDIFFDESRRKRLIERFKIRCEKSKVVSWNEEVIWVTFNVSDELKEKLKPLGVSVMDLKEKGGKDWLLAWLEERKDSLMDFSPSQPVI